MPPPSAQHVYLAFLDEAGLVLDGGTPAARPWVGRHYAELPEPVYAIVGVCRRGRAGGRHRGSRARAMRRLRRRVERAEALAGVERCPHRGGVLPGPEESHGAAGAAPLPAEARAAVARLEARQRSATADELAALDGIYAAIDARSGVAPPDYGA